MQPVYTIDFDIARRDEATPATFKFLADGMVYEATGSVRVELQDDGETMAPTFRPGGPMTRRVAIPEELAEAEQLAQSP